MANRKRPIRTSPHAGTAALGLALVIAVGLAGQDASTPLTLLSRDGREAIPLTIVNSRPYIALADLATTFQLTVREETGAVTVAAGDRIIVLTVDRSLASADGQLVSLPAPPIRTGDQVFVPLDFINLALARVYDTRLDLRRESRLLVVGDLRVPQVTVRHAPVGSSARVTVDISPAAASTVTLSDDRLIIRVDADALDVAFSPVEPEGLVEAISQLDAVSLAIDTGPRFGGYQTTTQTIGITERLTIQLEAAVTETVVVPPPDSPEAIPDPDGVDAPELPQFSSGPGPIRTVVIDPGHGGEDHGVSSPQGLLEKNLTLSVARRLRSLLENRLGLRVLLTRDDDRFVPIDRRAALANNNKAGAFISLHANASPRESARGASIYVAAFDEQAEAHAALAQARVPVVGGGSRVLELVFWDVAQIRHLDRSSQLARIIEQRFRGRIPLDSRPFAQMPFRVLESANMPAVLVEMGYLTNTDQAGRLQTGALQDTIARAIADALVQFRELQPTGERGDP